MVVEADSVLVKARKKKNMHRARDVLIIE